MLSLALGIGANTAIFSLVNAAAAAADAGPRRAVARVGLDDRSAQSRQPAASHLNFKDIRAQNPVFTDMAAFTFASELQRTGRSPSRFPRRSSRQLLLAARREPALGRGFLPEEETKATPVAVLSHGFWQRSLGRIRPSSARRSRSIARLSRSSASRRRTSPACCSAADRRCGCRCRCTVVQPAATGTRTGAACSSSRSARLKPGVTVEQARSNLRTVFANLEQAFPVDNKGRSATAVAAPGRAAEPERPGGQLLVQLSTVLMIVVGIVLLIACANSRTCCWRARRAAARVAIRLALGADDRVSSSAAHRKPAARILGGAPGLSGLIGR